MVQSYVEYATVVLNKNREYKANSTEVAQVSIFRCMTNEFIFLGRAVEITKFLGLYSLFTKIIHLDLLFFHQVLFGRSGLPMISGFEAPTYVGLLLNKIQLYW